MFKCDSDLINILFLLSFFSSAKAQRFYTKGQVIQSLFFGVGDFDIIPKKSYLFEREYGVEAVLGIN